MVTVNAMISKLRVVDAEEKINKLELQRDMLSKTLETIRDLGSHNARMCQSLANEALLQSSYMDDTIWGNDNYLKHIEDMAQSDGWRGA